MRAVALVCIALAAASAQDPFIIKPRAPQMVPKKSRAEVDGVPGWSNVGGASGGMECWMCKKLLPHVKTHECTSKCSGWWHWTQAACEDVT